MQGLLAGAGHDEQSAGGQSAGKQSAGEQSVGKQSAGEQASPAGGEAESGAVRVEGEGTLGDAPSAAAPETETRPGQEQEGRR